MLARNPKITLFFAGGQINSSRDGFADGLNLEFISKFRPDVAFIGASGVDIKRNSLSSRDSADGLHKTRLIELSKSSYVMAESRKIGVEGTYSFATLEKISGVITDAKLSKTLSSAVEKLGVKIISAG